MARFNSLAIGASTTDGAIVTGIPGKKVRITSLLVVPGASTTVTLNSKPAGAGTALTPALGAVTVLPPNSDGWFESNVGEGISVTTSAGAPSAVTVNYIPVSY
jgi:hypothetical protein